MIRNKFSNRASYVCIQRSFHSLLLSIASDEFRKGGKQQYPKRGHDSLNSLVNASGVKSPVLRTKPAL
jgi:hypothetical protein